MTSPSPDFRPKQIATRFIYPFFFERDQAEAASDALLKFTLSTGDAIWECRPVPELYREELLHHVDKFLFENTARGCKHLNVSHAASTRWFNHLAAILVPEKPSGSDLNRALLSWPVKLISGAGLELFLTNYGVGVLAIALQPDEVSLDFDGATLFNYKLAQFRPDVAAKLGIRHPSENQDAWARMPEEQKAKIAQPLAADAPIADRLGAKGGYFTLAEVALFILQPLEGLGLKAFQSQFSIYTTIRFGEDVDLNLPEVRKSLAPFLASMAQIEEPTHAGSPDDVIAVRNEILNRRHWAAVGLLAVAHFVADQPDAHPFNTQRVLRVMTKYFVPYVAAGIQRLSLQLSVRDATNLVLHKRSEMQSGLSKLRKHMLEFALEGYFPEVSHREVLDRYYRMLQEGLGVRRAYEDVSRAIADLDAQFEAEHQAAVRASMNRNLNATRMLQEQAAKMQHKVSMLERFLVSVYAAELWHLIASSIDRLHKWEPHGVIAFAILGFLGAWALERFWQDREPTTSQ